MPENNTEKKKAPVKPQQPMPFRSLLMWMLLFGIVLGVFQMLSGKNEKVENIPYYPDFVQLLENPDQLREVEIISSVSDKDYIIRGTRMEMDPATSKPAQFKTQTPVVDDLINELRAQGITFTFKTQNPYVWQLLTGAIPFILVFGLLYFFFIRQMKSVGKGAMSFGKSRARLLTRDKNGVTFDDVAGVDEAREEVQEIVEFLKNPKKFQKLGGRIPKGVMLAGPPGTGKTLLAKAIAGEAHVPFFSISGSDFVEMFVGVGASRVRDMFEQGKKSAPCIIFIDEIDAVGRSRFTGIGGGHDEREQTLNALLVEMDGFDTSEGVIILAATNRPDVLDNALLRPGRFDRQIYVDLPGLDGREAIMKIHSKKVKLGAACDLRRIARGTPGFSGADLANLINEAALIAGRCDAEEIGMADLEEARDKVRWGRERRSRILGDNEKKLTAYHESGHAIVLQVIPECDPLHKVTIIPRGQALGATMQLPEKDEYTQGRNKLLGMIAGLMGGRVAEEIIFDDVTTGAQSDFKQATHIARLMVCEWGMSDVLGPQNFGDRQELMFLGREVNRSIDHSEETSRKIDAEVNRILREQHDRAKAILEKNRELLDQLAELLLERETLDGVDCEELFKHGRILDAVERQEAKEAAEGGPAEAEDHTDSSSDEAVI